MVHQSLKISPPSLLPLPYLDAFYSGQGLKDQNSGFGDDTTHIRIINIFIQEHIVDVVDNAAHQLATPTFLKAAITSLNIT